jgi:hypothetical protein
MREHYFIILADSMYERSGGLPQSVAAHNKQCKKKVSQAFLVKLGASKMSASGKSK